MWLQFKPLTDAFVNIYWALHCCFSYYFTSILIFMHCLHNKIGITQHMVLCVCICNVRMLTHFPHCFYLYLSIESGILKKVLCNPHQYTLPSCLLVTTHQALWLTLALGLLSTIWTHVVYSLLKKCTDFFDKIKRLQSSRMLIFKFFFFFVNTNFCSSLYKVIFFRSGLHIKKQLTLRARVKHSLRSSWLYEARLWLLKVLNVSRLCDRFVSYSTAEAWPWMQSSSKMHFTRDGAVGNEAIWQRWSSHSNRTYRHMHS